MSRRRFWKSLSITNQTPRSRKAGASLAIDKHFVDWKQEITLLCTEAASTQQERTKVVVVGGFEDLGGLHEVPRGLDGLG